MKSASLACAFVFLLQIPALGLADPPDMETIADEVDRVWKADVASWADYAFRRHVTRLSFDKKGREKFRLEMLFQVTPKDDGFDEELLEIEGREPKKGEVKDHRRAARFTRHYGQAGELELDNPVGEDLALLPLIQSQEYRFVGEDVVDEIPCYRYRFDAREEPPDLTTRERLRYALEGTACVSKIGYHLVAFEMETARSIKTAEIGLNFLRLTIKGHAVGDAWLPKLVELQSDVVLLGTRLRKGNIYRYTDFRYQPAE